MALVTTSITAVFSRTVFNKMPDWQRNQTSQPRALVQFHIDTVALDAKPINDDQLLIVSVNLPFQFAYRLVDLNLVIIQDVATSWTDVPFIEATNGIRGLPLGNDQRWPLTLQDSTLTGVPGGAFNMTVSAAHSPLPQVLFQSIAAGVSPVITVKATNQNTPAGAAGTVDFYMSFLEFEIEQAWNASMFWPLSILNRN